MVRLRLMILVILTLSWQSLRAEQLSDSVRVHFRVNKTVIDTLLMGNEAAMRGFADRLHALSSNDTVNVTINSILITGAASPEGSIPYNRLLSERRAGAITRWLASYFEFPDSVAKFVFKGRDWQGLLSVVIDDPDVPHQKEVVELLYDIVGTHHGASAPTSSAKRDGVARLKALRGGVPYRYLLRKHFPGLRASEVFINATVEPIDNVGMHPGASENIAENAAAPVVELPIDTIPQIAVDDTIAYIGGCAGVHPYVFALKTDMLYDVLATPSIGIEFPIGKHFSVGANWMYAWWQNRDRNRHWRIYGGDINARYYFGRTHQGASLQGHHVGVYGQVLVFQIAFGGKGYITGIPGENLWGKPYLGGGIEYGYSKRIGKRLNIDFSLGLGYMAGEYRVYRPIDDHYVWQSSHRRNWIGPTKAEISLVWLIGPMGRKLPASGNQKGGAR